MSETEKTGVTRRGALKAGAGLAALAAANGGFAHAFAGADTALQVALVGCGGRGTGAAENALSTSGGPIKLVAMADVFQSRLDNSHEQLSSGKLAEKVEVPNDRKFVGFDGYKNAIDCLKPGDIAIFATPPAFRWVHFKYAIEKGVNVFMEKPVTVDGPTSKRMLALAEESEKKGLKVGVGLMCRHCPARQELRSRIEKGELGEIVLLRAYRMAGPTARAFAKAKPENMSELLYQIQEFHAFLWASGGAVSDFLIHNIDECCWMKGAWPVEVQALGGRHYRGDYVDQNFDSYSMEYTFADGSKFLMCGRTMEGCHNEFASYAHGTKGSAVISASGHWPARVRIFKGQKMTAKEVAWNFPADQERNPYQGEWDELVSAIRTNKPFNEARRGIEASVVTSMGRMAAHTGRVVTYDDMLNCEHEFAPGLDSLTMDSPAPLQLMANGKYPVPLPGIITRREYDVI